MSDLLTRLAARAVGVAAVAQPLALPPFDASGLEVVDGEHMARPAAGPGAEPAAATDHAEAVQASTPEGPAPDVPRPTAVRPAAHETAARVQVVARPDAGASPVPPTMGPQPVPTPAPLVAASPLPGPLPTASPPHIVSARPLPAVPSRVTSPARTDDAPEADAPTVRIHIGRLEVRANLTQVPPPKREPPAAAGQELSLSDYLRGDRDVR